MSPFWYIMQLLTEDVEFSERETVYQFFILGVNFPLGLNKINTLNPKKRCIRWSDFLCFSLDIGLVLHGQGFYSKPLH